MEFKQSVITNKGRALMAKLLSGKTVAQFTRIAVSSQIYTDGQLATLTSLANVKQSTTVQAKPNNAATVAIEGAINNTGLSAGYYINTIGVYATDPDEGEILYSVAIAINNGYMPADTGVSKSGLLLEVVTEVSNAANVNMTVNPAAVATKADIIEVRDELLDIKSFVGYNDSDVYGVEVDVAAKTFKRLAGAVLRTPGAGFDAIRAFGGRRRCIITDEGKVVAYFGEAGYTETGALLQQVTVGLDTFPIGTKVQVMVEQPKFYYRVVPLVLEKIVDGIGEHLRKARYYVSDRPKAGFALHPAFISAGEELDALYLSAYEGSLYDESTATYILDDAQVADFAADRLSSIAGVKPISGLTQNLSRANARLLAQKRGEGWQQQYSATAALTQLLMLIEYNTFNMQTALGAGVTGKADGTGNESEPTGATALLGNNSGTAKTLNGYDAVSYRGEENPYGNIFKFVDGLNVMANGIHQAYIADNAFADSKKDGSYRNAGITLAKTPGYISAFGYSPVCDYLFLPSETLGSSALPVGDQFSQNAAATDGAGWRTAYLGGLWDQGTTAGAFYLYVYNVFSTRHRSLGARSVYARKKLAV